MNARAGIEALQGRYLSGTATPEREVDAQLARIGRSRSNAFVHVRADAARAEAALATAALREGRAVGALHGVTVAVKDLIDVAGTATTCGSAQHLQRQAGADAPAVARLRAAGAIVIGKANTHEFAYGATGDRSHFGPVANPHDPARMAGGSSSGSAAAVSEGLAHAALGTDTSGSIRIPSALCGVVGLKPSFDLLPLAGVQPLSRSLDHVGPVAGTVRDCALLLSVLAQAPLSRYWSGGAASLAGRTVGVPTDYFGEPVQEAVAQALRRAQAVLARAGAKLVAIAVQGLAQAHAAQQCILQVEALDQHAQALRAGAPFGEEVRERLQAAQHVLASDYLAALREQAAFRDRMDRVFGQVDALLVPTYPMTAPLLQERETALEAGRFPTRWLITRCTVPASLSGHPALSVPFGRDGRGLPIGVQLVGPMHGECGLFDVGAALEEAGEAACGFLVGAQAT